MDNVELFKLLLVLPGLVFFCVLMWRRATLYDNPELLLELDESTWKPKYLDIVQAETISTQLTKICVITSNRFTSGHSIDRRGLSAYFSDDWDVDGGILPEYPTSDLLRCIQRRSLDPLRKVQLSDIKTTLFESFGVTQDGDILNLRKGDEAVESHAEWLASKLSIEFQKG